MIVPQIAVVFIYYFNQKSSWSSCKLSGITLCISKTFDEFLQFQTNLYNSLQDTGTKTSCSAIYIFIFMTHTV